MTRPFFFDRHPARPDRQGCRGMTTATVEIRDNQTGEIRRYRDDWNADSVHLWTEGAFSHDGNRARLFARAGGEPDRVDTGDGWSRYTAIRAICDDGSVVDLDDAREEA